MTFELTSAALREGQPIPRQYSGEGANVSPPLKWSEPPAQTKGFALLCEDPDAPRGTFTHWILFNLPAEVRELSEDQPQGNRLANGAAQGTNDFGKVGYGGPKPPPGKPHRYHFRLYALDQPLPLEPGTKRNEFLTALQGHVLGEVQLTGTYQHGQR
jgi:Raf kinase inhibitor-like YbhB/YbcL family protein